jgi:hypothetical protein
MGKLTQEEVEHLVGYHRNRRISQDDYDRIMRLFLTPSTCTVPKLLELLGMLITAGVRQRYMNEVKAFLRENDEALYRIYALHFSRNTGCMEAFGIRGEARRPSSTNNEPDHFVSMKPVLSQKKRKHGTGRMRRELRNEARALAQHKLTRERYEAGKYRKKMKEVHAKIRKGS